MVHKASKAANKRDSGASDEEPNVPALPTGLHKHTNGTYYYRRRVPTDLLVFYKAPKNQEKFSLGVKNYKDAVERFYVSDAQIQEKWRRWRQELADEEALRSLDAIKVLSQLSEDDLEDFARDFEETSLYVDEKQRESRDGFRCIELV